MDKNNNKYEWIEERSSKVKQRKFIIIIHFILSVLTAGLLVFNWLIFIFKHDYLEKIVKLDVWSVTFLMLGMSFLLPVSNLLLSVDFQRIEKKYLRYLNKIDNEGLE